MRNVPPSAQPSAATGRKVAIASSTRKKLTSARPTPGLPAAVRSATACADQEASGPEIARMKSAPMTSAMPQPKRRLSRENATRKAATAEICSVSSSTPLRCTRLVR